MKKHQKVELVKSASIAAVLRQAEVINRDLAIDALDEHLVGCPLDLVRAARYAVRHHGISVDAATQAVKIEAAKRRDRIAKEDRERRARFTYESEKARAEKSFAESLERVNRAIEAESDPFLRGFLISAIPEEPAILKENGLAKSKTASVVKTLEKTEKVTTAKTPKTENRKAAIVEVLKNGASKTADIATAIGSDTQTVSKYVSAYVKSGQWVKDSKGYVSLAHGTRIA